MVYLPANLLVKVAPKEDVDVIVDVDSIIVT